MKVLVFNRKIFMRFILSIVCYHFPVMILFFINIITSFIGIAERTDGPFSLVWLTNAVVIGVLLRFYDHVNWRHYTVCCAGMIIPDLIVGTDNIQMITMTCANFMTISAGYFFLKKYADNMETEWFSNLYCVPKMLLLCQPALFLGSIVGSSAIAIIYNKSYFLTASYWYLNESLNFIVLLPLILVIPKSTTPFSGSLMSCIRHMLPSILLLLIFFFIKDKIHFLMASIFIIPTIVWLALSGNLFLTTFGISMNGTFFFLWLIHSSHDYLFFPEESYVSIVRVIITAMALCALMIAASITERDKLFHQISYISNHDDLTGILNRRAFIKSAEETIATLTKDNICTMVLIDIDFFKIVNDKLGHQTGDSVLIEFCHQLKKCLPANQLFGRIGGEEFALLLANTLENNHQKIVDNIVYHFYQNPLFINGEPYPLTISAGMVEWSEGERYETLFKYADQALYLAKTSGRNQLKNYRKQIA